MKHGLIPAAKSSSIEPLDAFVMTKNLPINTGLGCIMLNINWTNLVFFWLWTMRFPLHQPTFFCVEALMKGDERSKQQVELVDLHKGQAQTLSKEMPWESEGAEFSCCREINKCIYIYYNIWYTWIHVWSTNVYYTYMYIYIYII